MHHRGDFDKAGRYDYELPDEAIAQVPTPVRSDSRLLVDRGPDTPPGHRRTRDLPELLAPGDVVVVNDSRVLPARLHLHKPTGGAVEVLVLEPRRDGTDDWTALVKPSRRVADGTVLADRAGADVLVVGPPDPDGARRVTPCRPDVWFDVLDSVGTVPLPPYITDELDDPGRYQTVFADRPGSVAAPTAGLHFTEEVLARCRRAGATIATVELRVGLGTFRPIMVDDLDDHVMHGEWYSIPDETRRAVETAGRVVAVGTTVVRALESAAATGEAEGRTELFIRPGHRFVSVDRLVTNFHLPRSSLLVLVEAFVGARWRALYETALAEGYRFLSFGDAMWLVPERERA